jgi:hypothetical protein
MAMKKLNPTAKPGVAISSRQEQHDAREDIPWTGRSHDEYQRDIQYLAENDAEFNERYKDQWVAVLDQQVIAHAKDYGQLLKDLEGKGLLEREPVIDRCPAVPEHAIFF